MVLSPSIVILLSFVVYQYFTRRQYISEDEFQGYIIHDSINITSSKNESHIINDVVYDYEYGWDFQRSNQENMIKIDELIDNISPEQINQKFIIHKYINETNLYHREKATFLILCRNSDLIDILETIQNVEDRFNKNFHYDYTFLNDEKFTNEFIYLISSFIPFGTINFGSIPAEHWEIPQFIDLDRFDLALNQDMRDIVYGDSISYRKMCRFFSGFFYKHELVKPYQYYWRIEPGIKLYCDINYDVFEFMHSNHKKYGFTLTMFEYENTIPSLWSDFQQFITMYDDDENQYNSNELMKLIQNQSSNTYNLCHFWTNFEIGDFSLFTSDAYEKLFTFFDYKGGFFYERWGDAPIHSLAIAISLKKSDLHWFGDIGYYHKPYLQCPKSSLMFINNKCSCNQDDDFSFTDLSCTNHFLNVINGL
ncbi:mannosyltransferase [Scheffersomyces coipomensis]|uniref:mannosyltransferase n=1 Tax=Scheffersomyces coipomensis TaxID=1788519 RepID=UPI00315DE5FE